MKHICDYWNKCTTNVVQDKLRFRDGRILDFVNKGESFQQANERFLRGQKQNPRHYSPDLKPFQPSPSWPYKMTKISPILAEVLTRRKFIPTSTKVKVEISEELKAKRAQVKETLMGKGIDEYTANKLVKAIK